jgi:hypothetical protein
LSEEDATAMGRRKEWMSDYLKDGPRLADAMRGASVNAGFKPRTYQRAKVELKLVHTISPTWNIKTNTNKYMVSLPTLDEPTLSDLEVRHE